MESPSRSTIKYPSQGLQEGRVLCTAVRPVGTNNSKRPIPNPKAQGSDPLVHRSELQHMAAELGSYKQAHTSSPRIAHPGQLQSSGGSSPAPLKELGSRAQAMRGGIGSIVEAPCHDCYPNHIAPAPHGPSCGWLMSTTWQSDVTSLCSETSPLPPDSASLCTIECTCREQAAVLIFI
ncbi:hypothetical protein L3Q82_014508 [Scortum barcoo]|uniref:Uncharacterized protein n=1 Tax=Scortum barcoo TaxID=214431 RepID=A0ACB8VZ62_9TELE|nr:hypothetical protein L3Q82_014508 [Scortum barcoo]